MLTKRLTLLLAAVTLVAYACFGEEKLREWSDTTGAFQIDASFVSYADGKVTLRRFDGKTITVAISRLSKPDRKYVRERIRDRSSPARRLGADGSVPPALESRPPVSGDPGSAAATRPEHSRRVRRRDPLTGYGVLGCRVCRNMRALPRANLPLYIHSGDPAAADPALLLGCRHCPACASDADDAALVLRERKRLDSAGARHAAWERKLQMSLQRIETRQLVVRGHTSKVELQRVAQAVEAMTMHLRQITNSLLLTPRQPATDEMFVFDDKPEYEQFLGLLEEEGHYPHVDWRLMRKRIGSTAGRISFLHSPHDQAPAEHSAVHASAYRQIQIAMAGRASPWLLEGFAAYCEHLVTRKNLIHGVVAQSGEVKLTANWAAQLRHLARTEEPLTWRDLIGTELALYRPIHYLQAKSIVTFLLRDSPAFLDFVELKSVDLDDTRALEVAYGRSVDELDEQWRGWLGR